MGKEIERKFLVHGDEWRALATGVLLRQGYLNKSKERTVRVRTVGEEAFLTIKGPTHGSVRDEYEYEIPLDDGIALLETLAEKPVLEKKRYTISVGDFVWEVDEFMGENSGLVVAEIELAHEDDAFLLPPWVGQEVTGDPRYYNSCLCTHPYSQW